MCLRRIDAAKDLADEIARVVRAPQTYVCRAERVCGGKVVGLRAIDRLKLRDGVVQTVEFVERESEKQSRLIVFGLRVDDLREFARSRVRVVRFVVGDAEIQTDCVLRR